MSANPDTMKVPAIEQKPVIDENVEKDKKEKTADELLADIYSMLKDYFKKMEDIEKRLSAVEKKVTVDLIESPSKKDELSGKYEGGEGGEEVEIVAKKAPATATAPAVTTAPRAVVVNSDASDLIAKILSGKVSERDVLEHISKRRVI